MIVNGKFFSLGIFQERYYVGRGLYESLSDYCRFALCASVSYSKQNVMGLVS